MTALRNIAAVLFVSMLAGCAGGDDPAAPPAGPTRSYAMGFTDFPFDATAAAYDEAWRVITAESDLVVLHFDGGVPWQEALDGTPYPALWRADLDGKAARVPDRHKIYLAVTPIAFARNALALNQGDAANQPLPAPWDTRGFGDAEVRAAYLNHCERMIARFDPDWFAYAIEANMVRSQAPALWDDFVGLAAHVYSNLKVSHPDLPVFVSLQADFFNADRGDQAPALAALWPYTDYVAVSAYPYAVPMDGPQFVAGDYFSALAAQAADKPFAFAETAWPAEPVGAPYPIDIPGSEIAQRAYLERVLAECDARSAAFLCWFFTRDYDDFWDSQLSGLPDAPIFRIWKDAGLYAGDGAERMALQAWREAQAVPLR